jgi:hypothetical protein
MFSEAKLIQIFFSQGPTKMKQTDKGISYEEIEDKVVQRLQR